MQTHSLTPTRRRAFTLIEIMIVIVIMLAIGTLVVVNLMPQQEQSYIRLQKVQLKEIDKALKVFKLDLNRWPTQEEGLSALWNKDAITDDQEVPKWHGPYLEDPVTKDRWGQDLVYRVPSEVRGEGYYDLISTGPDKAQDTSDDITNFDEFKAAEAEGGGAGTTTPPSGTNTGSTSGAGGT